MVSEKGGVYCYYRNTFINKLKIIREPILYYNLLETIKFK